MSELVIKLCDTLARKSVNKTLNEFEHLLYEAAARYTTTVLRFQDAISQSAVLKAERDLDETCKAG